MIRFLCLLALLASPATAQRASETARCEAGWRHLVGIVIGYEGGGMFDFTLPDEWVALRELDQKPDVDGWCRVISGDADLLSDDTRVAWRAMPADFADDPNNLPTELAFRFDAMMTQNGRSESVQTLLKLSHSPGDGLLIVDGLGVFIDDQEALTASAVIGGAYFDDPRAAQMSLLGLHLDQLALTATLTPANAHLLKDIARADVVDFVEGLSFAQMDRRSRSEALDFARALPRAAGVLDVTFASDRGLGLMQIGVATSRDKEDMPGFLLDGAQMAVDWQPK